MDSFIDNCLNKLKLKKFQVAKIPKKHKFPHFHHSYGDEEREDTCKICRKENEKNIITAASIRTRLKIFEIKSPGIKHKADLCKKRAMKNLFDLIDEENKESDQVDELQPKFPSVENKTDNIEEEALCLNDPGEMLIDSKESLV